MQVPGFWELLVIAVVALIIFGPRRLPEIGQALGRGIREFRSAVKEVTGGGADDGGETSQTTPRRGQSGSA